nr:DUF4162 domain-containing protein [Duncaniella sp.]
NAHRGRNVLTLRLNDDATVRSMLEIANREAEIASFRESIASMNDIFIKAVKSDQKN